MGYFCDMVKKASASYVRKPSKDERSTYCSQSTRPTGPTQESASKESLVTCFLLSRKYIILNHQMLRTYFRQHFLFPQYRLRPILQFPNKCRAQSPGGSGFGSPSDPTASFSPGPSLSTAAPLPETTKLNPYKYPGQPCWRALPGCYKASHYPTSSPTRPSNH